MLQETDSHIDSSNNIKSTRLRNAATAARTQPKRHQIYDEQDFKEVVKNFYTLISDINKTVKRVKQPIQKKQPQQQLQAQKRQQQKKQPIIKEERVNKNELYNFKKDSNAYLFERMQLAQPHNLLTQQMINQLSSLMDCDQHRNLLQHFPQPKKLKEPKFSRNSFHIAIAYDTYLKNQGPNISQNQDPTYNARKKLQQDTSASRRPEEEKEPDPRKLADGDEDRKKPLTNLVQELQQVFMQQEDSNS